MDWSEVTKKTLIVVMWIALISSVIGGLIYCCYLGYEWTMRLRPSKGQGRHAQAGGLEKTMDDRVLHGKARGERERERAMSPPQRREDHPRPKDRRRRYPQHRRAAHQRGRHPHGGRSRSFSTSRRTSADSTLDGRKSWHTTSGSNNDRRDNHGQRRRRRGDERRQEPGKMRIKIIRNKLDKFPRKRK